MSATEVIAVLDQHWFNLSPPQRDAYTHILLEHPDRVAIFDDIFRRAKDSQASAAKRRN